MRLEVPYGKSGTQSLYVPDENLLGVLRPSEVERSDEMQVIREGLDERLGSLGLQRFLEGAEKVVVIVNDGTRPTPTARILHALEERMDLAKVRFLVATGAHRAPTDDEYEQIFGERIHRLRPNIHAHDARKDKMAYLGRTRFGTEIWINEIAVDADRLVIITSVEPHYFAGFTGGRKSILPGVASYASIEQNHRLALRPEAKSLALEGNPVHEDMMDAIKSLDHKPIFAIQVVLDRHQQVYRVASGDLEKSFQRAVLWANEAFCAPIERKADIVISIASYPMDVDLYQSQKAIENAMPALREGGTLIFVSKCRSGIGDQAFYDKLAVSKDPDIVLENLAVEYRLGYHKAAKMAEAMKRVEICGVTALDPQVLKKINIIPFESVQEALEAALEKKPNATVLVIYDGNVVVPRLV